MKKYMRLSMIVLVISILLVSVGYSAFREELSISSIATIIPTKNIKVSNLTVLSSSSADSYSNSSNYLDDSITVNVHLNDINSYVEYQVAITNLGNEKMGILTYMETILPDNLTYEIIGYNLHETLCDDNDNTNCTLNATKHFNIRIKYKENSIVDKPADYTINIGFNFKPIYAVTYSIPNIDYPTEIIEGGTLTVDMSNDSYIITAVTINGINTSDYSFNNGILTIPNVTGNVSITQQADYSDIEFLVDNNTTTISSTQITPSTPTDYNGILGMQFSGKNISDKIISQIDISYDYASLGAGASQTLNCILTIGENTYTSVITFLGKTTSTATISFNNIAINPGDDFLITYTVNNQKKQLSITSKTLSFVYKN